MPDVLEPTLVGLIDDAAIFPPGNADLHSASAAHVARRTEPWADLVGTFVPMFGINNAFGKLFGGGDNGMWGITFAVRGPLDKPDFKVNPLSLLAPGAFRGLFEYKAKEAPRVD